MRTVMAAHTANHVDLRLAALGRPQQPDDLENVTRMVAEQGRRLSARDYVNTLLMIHRTGRRLAGFFDGIRRHPQPDPGRSRPSRSAPWT